jgi:hypothetical protein
MKWGPNYVKCHGVLYYFLPSNGPVPEHLCTRKAAKRAALARADAVAAANGRLLRGARRARKELRAV